MDMTPDQYFRGLEQIRRERHVQPQPRQYYQKDYMAVAGEQDYQIDAMERQFDVSGQPGTHGLSKLERLPKRSLRGNVQPRMNHPSLQQNRTNYHPRMVNGEHLLKHKAKTPIRQINVSNIEPNGYNPDEHSRYLEARSAQASSFFPTGKDANELANRQRQALQQGGRRQQGQQTRQRQQPRQRQQQQPRQMQQQQRPQQQQPRRGQQPPRQMQQQQSRPNNISNPMAPNQSAAPTNYQNSTFYKRRPEDFEYVGNIGTNPRVESADQAFKEASQEKARFNSMQQSYLQQYQNIPDEAKGSRLWQSFAQNENLFDMIQEQ